MIHTDASFASALSDKVDKVIGKKPIRQCSRIEIAGVVAPMVASIIDEAVDSVGVQGVVQLVLPVFFGLPRGFDPRPILRELPPKTFERVVHEAAERGDGSDGPFAWFNLELATKKGLHVPDHPWEFHRLSPFVGECRMWLKDRVRSGTPLVVIHGVFGELNFDEYVEDIAKSCAEKGAAFEVAASTVPPDFLEGDMFAALRTLGYRLNTDWRGTQGGRQKIYVVNKLES